jgi:hypothetical protein
VHSQESFLNQVLRVLFVASHAKSEAEQGVTVAFYEDTKGLLIAFARRLGYACVGPFHPAGP